MTTNEEHLSMFELDLYFATRAADARIEEHVASCERCSGYLIELAKLQQGAALPALPVAPVPPARRSPDQTSPGRTSPGRTSPARRPRALAVSLMAGLAVLAAVSASLWVSRDEEAPAVAVKGSPGVQLLVRRGEATRPWNGSSSVQAGDVLGLRVACEEFEQVAVLAASGDERARWSPLFRGGCPPAGAALPFTLVVDEQPGREQVAVVFSRSPLDARALDDAIVRRRLDGEAWVIRFELDKEPSR